MRRAPGTGSVYRPGYTTASGEKRKGRLYWIAYRVGAETKREPTKTANRQDAEKLLRRRLALLDRGELPPSDRTTWDQLAEMIRADYKAHGRRSTARLEISLGHLGKTFEGTRAASITADRLRAYVTRRLEHDRAARATVNRELAALKRAFRLGHRTGHVAVVPYVALLREANARTGFFERAELDRLVRALPADLRPPVLAAYLTGWRLTSEILTREWRHVDLRAGWMRLEPGGTKSGEGRQFPLIPELRAALRAQRRATTALERRSRQLVPWVFHHEGEPFFYRAAAGGVLPSAYFRAAWSRACTTAGLEGRIPHDFRRTATRNLLRAGVPLPTVMAAVGWETDAMLRRYAIVGESELREAGKKLARLTP